MVGTGDYLQVEISSAASLREWLLENHTQKDSVWLVRRKKGRGRTYVSYEDVVDQLICFGWVDSLPRKLDADRSLLLISPRNPGSNWSARNKERVQRLAGLGWMEPSGLALVAEAKRNGAWNALDEVEQGILPPDLIESLEAYPQAARYFDRFPPSSKRGILEWIAKAKRPETRRRRVVETARKASQNLKANHPKGRDAGPADTLAP